MRDSDFKRKLFWECIDNLGSKGRSSAAKQAEPALHNAQQAKCAMLPCLGYLESECEDCVNYNLYRKS